MHKFPRSGGGLTVVFELPPGVGAEKAAILGDFTAWVPLEMSLRPDGGWELSVDLEPGSYRFRYLLDGSRWENDWAADRYEANGFGGDDSVIDV